LAVKVAKVAKVANVFGITPPRPGRPELQAPGRLPARPGILKREFLRPTGRSRPATPTPKPH